MTHHIVVVDSVRSISSRWAKLRQELNVESSSCTVSVVCVAEWGLQTILAATSVATAPDALVVPEFHGAGPVTVSRDLLGAVVDAQVHLDVESVVVHMLADPALNGTRLADILGVPGVQIRIEHPVLAGDVDVFDSAAESLIGQLETAIDRLDRERPQTPEFYATGPLDLRGIQKPDLWSSESADFFQIVNDCVHDTMEKILTVRLEKRQKIARQLKKERDGYARQPKYASIYASADRDANCLIILIDEVNRSHPNDGGRFALWGDREALLGGLIDPFEAATRLLQSLPKQATMHIHALAQSQIGHSTVTPGERVSARWAWQLTKFVLDGKCR